MNGDKRRFNQPRGTTIGDLPSWGFIGEHYHHHGHEFWDMSKEPPELMSTMEHKHRHKHNPNLGQFHHGQKKWHTPKTDWRDPSSTKR